MYIIPWHTNSTDKKSIADIGDVRLILKAQSNNWILSMGIRVYTKDGNRSMVRPPVAVLHIPMPCELNKAKKIADAYFKSFLSSIQNALNND